MDLSFSPDGTQLICSYAYIDNSFFEKQGCNLRLFDEVGANLPDRIVSANEEAFADKVVPEFSICQKPSRLPVPIQDWHFFHLKTERIRFLQSRRKKSGSRACFYSDKYVAFGNCKQRFYPEPEKLVVYQANGTKSV